jgi:hypothetical protein
MMDHQWDLRKARADRDSNRRLQALDDSLQYDLAAVVSLPDSSLSMISRMVKEEPALKYAPHVAYYTIGALLHTNPHGACEYIKETMRAPAYGEDPPYEVIRMAVDWHSKTIHLPAEIYGLGAEAYQAEIDHYPYPENVDLSKPYHKIAEWYRRAGNASKAEVAEQKAIQAENRGKGK